MSVKEMMGHHAGKIYVIIPQEMGCMTFYRRDDVGRRIEELFVHSDDWGQYDVDLRPVVDRFISGYQRLETQS